MEMVNNIPVSPANSLAIAQTEKQLWEIVKGIPGLNVAYGTVRCIVYVIKKDQQETQDSALGAAKGAIQTAALTAGIITAPVSIPVATGVLTGIAAKSVSETMEVIVFFVTNTEQFQGKTSDEREQLFYNKIRNVTGIGAVYSALRVPVYLFKKNKQETVTSGVNLLANTGGTAVEVGVSMIPHVDKQIQKLIEKTSRTAIKFLSKKIMDQISQHKLPLEQGISTIAKVEKDCQAIMEVTAGSEESGEKMEPTIAYPIGEEEGITQNDRRSDTDKTSCTQRCCCCSIFWCCHCRNCHRSKNVRKNNNRELDKVKQAEEQKGDPDPDIKNNGHLIILTE